MAAAERKGRVERETPRIRTVHARILASVERALGERSWQWLSEQAGIPQSTLSTQVGKPKFSLDVLYRICCALDLDLSEVLEDAYGPRSR